MVDARGYSCPLPVLMVQKAVEKDAPAQLEVLLDEMCAVGNVKRYATNQGYTVAVEEQNGEYRLLLKK